MAIAATTFDATFTNLDIAAAPLDAALHSDRQSKSLKGDITMAVTCEKVVGELLGAWKTLES
jgi:hypothetical protein